MEILDDKIKFDPETGEIIETSPIMYEDLPKVVRWMRSIEAKIIANEKYSKEEMNRINEICQHSRGKLLCQYGNLLSMAQGLMTEAGEKKVNYPGLGTLRWQKGRETVNTAGFDELSDEFKQDCLKQRPDLFAATFRPAKKAIMSELSKTGEFFVYDGYFTLETAPDKFVFKPE